MGLIIKEYTKRDGRGRSGKVQVVAGFDHPGIFDIRYNAALHRHFILVNSGTAQGDRLHFWDGTKRNRNGSKSMKAMCPYFGRQQSFETRRS
jgi:hypothetical protein